MLARPNALAAPRPDGMTSARFRGSSAAVRPGAMSRSGRVTSGTLAAGLPAQAGRGTAAGHRTDHGGVDGAFPRDEASQPDLVHASTRRRGAKLCRNGVVQLAWGCAFLGGGPQRDDLQTWMKRSSLAIALVFAGVAATLLAWLVGLAWVVISIV